MSYILQALKKDEADSDPQAAARLALAEQRSARPWALWGIGIALLINAGVLGYLFYPDLQSRLKPSAPVADTAPLTGTTNSPTTAAASRPDTTQRVPPATTAAASRAVTVRPRSRVAPPGQVAATPQRRPAGPSAERSAELAANPGEITIGPNSPPAQPERGGGRVLSPAEAEALNLIPAGRVPATTRPVATAPSPAPVSREQPPVILLAELPPADRQSFPKLEFSTHIFADDPALRAVVVNSKRLNEGESIGEMVLRAVTEDGILVDYRGYRVAVSVIEEWN